jgi:hypothetical protein
MPWIAFRYLDGPCLNNHPAPVSLQAPPRTLQCGGRTYVLFAETKASRTASYDLTASYAVSGGSYDHSPERIRHQRDLFRAWARLHRALNHQTVRGQARARAAGRGLRRLVR